VTADTTPGQVILVGAPLGNPADASEHMRTVLSSADVIAAEDTRRLYRLARHLGVEITARVVSYFEANEERRTPELVALAAAGSCVALVTDAGMPGVSDPGFRLVRAAIEAGVPVVAAPGPSAVTTALALSGLPTDRFCFEGFLPRRPSERRARLAAIASEERTLVLFEAPHRLVTALIDIAAAFGPDRPGAVCRELTKTYEEIRRAPLADLVAWAQADAPRGEITLVIGGAARGPIESPGDMVLADEVAAAQADGLPRKQAIAEVARRHGVRKREVYEAVLRHR
jgi:16S rRNA (cytidine1402-2'-O)-methyltransferase